MTKKKIRSNKTKKTQAVPASPIPEDIKAEMEAFDTMFQEYAPKSKQEEKELCLAKIIANRERVLMDRMAEADELKSQLREFDLEKEVYKRVMKANPKKREEWKYNASEDFVAGERRQLAELEDWMAYDAAWLSAAREMIKTKKYKDISTDVLEHFHFDGEGRSSWHDEISFPNRAAERCKNEDCACCVF